MRGGAGETSRRRRKEGGLARREWEVGGGRKEGLEDKEKAGEGRVLEGKLGPEEEWGWGW